MTICTTKLLYSIKQQRIRGKKKIDDQLQGVAALAQQKRRNDDRRQSAEQPHTGASQSPNIEPDEEHNIAKRSRTHLLDKQQQEDRAQAQQKRWDGVSQHKLNTPPPLQERIKTNYVRHPLNFLPMESNLNNSNEYPREGQPSTDQLPAGAFPLLSPSESQHLLNTAPPLLKERSMAYYGQTPLKKNPMESTFANPYEYNREGQHSASQPSTSGSTMADDSVGNRGAARPPQQKDSIIREGQQSACQLSTSRSTTADESVVNNARPPQQGDFFREQQHSQPSTSGSTRRADESVVHSARPPQQLDVVREQQHSAGQPSMISRGSTRTDEEVWRDELKMLIMEMSEKIENLDLNIKLKLQTPTSTLDEDEHTDEKVITNMSSHKPHNRAKTDSTETFRVMNCPTDTIGTLTEFENELLERRKRRAIRNALQESIMKSNNDKNNLSVARAIMGKLASEAVWTHISVSGRSGTKKLSLEHKFPKIFSILHHAIADKTTFHLTDVKKAMSSVLRSNQTAVKRKNKDKGSQSSKHSSGRSGAPPDSSEISGSSDSEASDLEVA